jgi:hypothetical protein
MRRNLAIIVLLLLTSACCKKELVIGLQVNYPDLNSESELMVSSLDKHTALVVDTVHIGLLNEMNDYTHFVRLRDPYNYDYLFEVNATYSDTITDFTYNTKGYNCNTRVDEVNYKLNGESRTETGLIIQ